MTLLNRHREIVEKISWIEMIYEPSSDDIKVEKMGSGTFVQMLDGIMQPIHAQDGDILLQHKVFADLAHLEHAEVSATTRSQTKPKRKRVHFEDEAHKGMTTAEATETPTEDLTMQVQRPSAEVRHEPTADDIDPSNKSEGVVSPGPGRGAEAVESESCFER
ncbi:LOW QUALITY PROTEIN: hypothetical protein PHMEG_00020608 [Phytophthora megakarya]|uniref:Uncharacterized protein n=1 Tax=Phytophthora megakarya TaxID=4795 RepID=A0A225VNY7_9STRA|nr:LOW QUALITY PROTEIN: hypothetical protein PHMEG_00020608 [Phytophthora megakarya]